MTDDQDPHPVAGRIAESVREQLDEGGRRQFLTRSGIVGGALLALGGGTGVALAEEHEDGEMGPKFDDVAGTDLDVLNYALALERVEDAFYTQALEMVSGDDFLESEAMAAYSEERRGAVYADLQSFAEHESTHVEALAGAVELLGGTVPEAGTYDFGVTEPADVVATGQVLENTGVAAYAGAAPHVESPDLLGVALSIHSVEARHAALLNQLAGESVAPDAFDEAAAQEDVLEAVSQFATGDTGMGGNESEGNETDTPGTPTPGGNESEGNESDTTWL